MRLVMLLFLAVTCPGLAVADDLCERSAEAARQIMKARQEGVPMDVLMQAAQKQKGDYAGLSKQMVIGAYERDRRYSEAQKQREIVEYGNDMYKLCLKS